MPHLKTQTEWEAEMAQKVLDFVRSELYLDLRFLDIALSALIPKADTAIHAFATDGVSLRYPAAQLLHTFRHNPKFLNRAYLHLVLHCLFSHLWIAGERDRRLWDIACDIAVEYTIDGMDKPSTQRILTWLRQHTYEQLAKDGCGLSAAVIYRWLFTLPDGQQQALQQEFYTDDHCYWPIGRQQVQQQITVQRQWEKIARQANLQQEGRHGTDTQDGAQLLAAQIRAGCSRRSYGDFLRKFTILREEIRCNPDEFDLNFYTYGLRLYQNLPLVEPLETTEVHKIREFVIVVDTSDSTSGELVRHFLRETFQILQEQERFFRKCSVRILQCDDRIRADQKLTDLGQAEQLLEHFTVIGGGGTDFRPAFRYVQGLLDQGVFQRLSGLLYFTDGKGIYPKKRPPYPTAFLFLDDYDTSAVPPWAMRLRLEKI